MFFEFVLCQEGERQSPLEGPQPLRCLGCALGPSATDPAFRHHASSNCVDLQREHLGETDDASVGA